MQINPATIEIWFHEILYDQQILLLDIYTKETEKLLNTNITAALFIITKKQGKTNLFTISWISKYTVGIHKKQCNKRQLATETCKNSG
jgi:hypothetical protein